MEQNETIVEVVGEEKKKNIKNLIIAGLLSALSGLLGCLVLGFLLSVGFVASISGIIITAAMFYTFQKFYKTNSKWLYVYIVGVAIVEIFLTVLIADGLIVQTIVRANEGLIISFGEAISLIFSEGELIGAFFTDFLMSVLFALIGIGIMIFDLVQRQKRREAVVSSMTSEIKKDNETVFTPATVVEKEDDNTDKNQDVDADSDKQ